MSILRCDDTLQAIEEKRRVCRILVVDCPACPFQHNRLRGGGQTPDSIEQRLQGRRERLRRHLPPQFRCGLSGESAVAALRSLTGVVECRQIGLDGDPALFYLVFKGLLAKRQHSAAAQGPQQNGADDALMALGRLFHIE